MTDDDHDDMCVCVCVYTHSHKGHTETRINHEIMNQRQAILQCVIHDN